MTMNQASAWTWREVWTRKLIYPGHTLPTAAAPVIVAIGLADHDRVFAALPVALAFLAGWLIQFAGVVTDNYSNLKREPDDREHPELVQAVKSGLLSLADLRNTILVSYSLAVLLGFALLALAGWPVIVIGLASILASWAYSAGPWPFGRHGFADPLFFLFFGTVSVIGAYYVQAAVVLGPEHWREALPLAAIAVSLPIGALITNILIIDDIRDCEFDVVKGKNTVAVRFGKIWSRYEFAGLLVFRLPRAILVLAQLRLQRLGTAAPYHATACLYGRPCGVDAQQFRRTGADDAPYGHADRRLFGLPGSRVGGNRLTDLPIRIDLNQSCHTLFSYFDLNVSARPG